MDIILPTILEYILKKILDKLETEFHVNLQKYRQFSECSTEKIIEEVYNRITAFYKNDTADMFLYAFANIYQTKVMVSYAGTDTYYNLRQSDNSSL